MIQSPEADTSAPPPPPVNLYLRKTCSGGPLIDVAQLPTSLEDVSLVALTKKLIYHILNASHKAETILSRLGALRGEEMVITHDGNTFTIKLPQLSKPNDMENVFGVLAQAVGCCQNIFGEFVKTFFV